MKRKILSSPFGPIAAVAANMLLALAVYAVARAEFLVENMQLFAAGIADGAVWNAFRGGIVFDLSAIAYTNALYVAMALFPLWHKETPLYHKVCKWLFVVVNTVCFAVNMADSVYFPYTMRRTTTSVFNEFSNEGNIAGIVFGRFVSHWYLVLLTAVVGWLMWRLYATPRTCKGNIAGLRGRMAFLLANLVSLSVAALLCIAACRGGLSRQVRPITVSNANQYVRRPAECALVLNTPFSLIRTIGKDVFKVPPYFGSLEEAGEIYTPVHNHSATGVKTADGKRPNIVLLIVESFGTEYIGALNKKLDGGAYRGYTPNVDSIIGRSAVWERSYCNGRKSIDAMPSILCGIPMFKEPFILTPASMHPFNGLAGLLAPLGYSSAFYHGAQRGSMGFMALANKAGFGEYYGREDYEKDECFGGADDFDGHWGIWDEPFLQYWCKGIGRLKEPFVTACFTLTSHDPYTVPAKYADTYPEEGLPIHKCIRYTDMAIGRFFESAAAQPWFHNTVFIIMSDHTNLSDHRQYQTDIGGFSSPVVFYSPGGLVEPGLRKGIAQQTDILPTVLGLVGYGGPHLAFGVDLFSTPAEETFAVNYLNGTYQYARNGLLLQFDGERATGLYRLDDNLMENNLLGRVPLQGTMERELKAIVYQYMHRMVNGGLLP